jgi:vacuolar iron transporter family protein
MKDSYKTGISFGLTSGIITTLGVMIGLNAGTGLRLAVIGGILTIAIADSASDALGIHVAQESIKNNSQKQIWEATAATFFTKLIVALSFLIPVLFFNLSTAVKINLTWGILLIIIFNYYLAKQNKQNPASIIFEHLTITTAVVAITFFAGKLIAVYFG